MTVSENRNREWHSIINSSLKVFDQCTTAGTSVYDYVVTEGSTVITYSDIETISSGIVVANAGVVGWQCAKWKNEHDGIEKIHELDFRSVNVMLGPPVELDASVTQRDN